MTPEWPLAEGSGTSEDLQWALMSEDINDD